MAVMMDSGSRSGERETGWAAVAKLVEQEKTPLSLGEKDRVIEEVPDEVFGLGPLGIRFKFYERLKSCGIALPAQLFQTVVEIN